ncbi:conserved hypothetical protein [Ricinus communis]|uniref:S-protein homolog n=1 Tax=Ricinus communis TaxID=3988 RepID=B9RTI2_RICCO|nr:conserved hypothetical protein [Ricinus communis]
MRTSSSYVLLLLMALALAMTQSCSGLFKRYHVHIVNNLEGGITNDLYLQCKSGDDDLGMQRVRAKDEFHFTFRKNLWGTTLYWCNFGWGKSHGGSFKVWWGGKNFTSTTGRNCVWSARNDGLYLLNVRINQFTRYYLWDK